MDKQLACATFATLIPVLLIAGYFAAPFKEMVEQTPKTYFSLMLTAMASEAFAILGVAVPDGPPQWLVYLAMAGTLLCVSGMFAAAGTEAVMTLRANKAAKEEPEEGNGADENDSDLPPTEA